MFFSAIVSIFMAEITIMAVLPYFPPLSKGVEAAVDGLLLSFILLPLFHVFLLRPLLAHIHQFELIDNQLRQANEDLEVRVREQTADLVETNKTLRQEIEWREKEILAREKAESVFSSIFEMSHDGIFVVDEKGIIQTVNPAGAAMFGYPPAGLVQRPLTEVMPERFREAHVRGMKRVVGQGQTSYIGRALEFAGLRKNGSEFPLELNVSKWSDNGNFYFSGVIRDITDRKAAEESIRNSEAKLNAIFNSTLDGILVVDPVSRKFNAGNRAICEMLGYTLDELVHLRVDLIHPEEDKARILKQYEQLAGGETAFAADIPVQRKDGTVFYADIVASPMIIGEQRFQIGVFRDVSRRREVEARLRQSQKLEAIGTLAGGIAHDFNNILAAILGFGELALEATRESSVQENLEQVIKAGNRARELIKQILSISRQSTLESSPQLMQVIAKEVVKLLRATIPATIEIRQDICSDCDPVLADPTQIHQILMNLGTNAFHAMEETGGVLKIDLRQIELGRSDDFSMFGMPPGRYVRLDVIDSGCGMEQEIIEHIFEPYYTTKAQGKGSGLGLAVVQGIVESHGGKIICRSDPGQGSTFSVVLPVAAKSEAASREVQQEITGGNERILLVDDEESLALLGKKNLESLGYRVLSVTSGLDALQRFRDNPQDFDLVITDQTMPHLAGDNLARKILEIRPDMPVILCTGHSSVINEELAKSIGIKAFLLKPITQKTLAESVRMVLNGTVK